MIYNKCLKEEVGPVRDIGSIHSGFIDFATSIIEILAIAKSILRIVIWFIFQLTIAMMDRRTLDG